ncbi:DUF3050 domain-containing protein [Sphingobacterium faecale]|uniref:DUF3050 domain-containing protein n=1 Tax=Sphingobacterium faecale TaxID=2803775 RepID=A0ABS1QYT7_9SPHI|nr:DUF3050 domain-containing protein [Sphingobacterium faecale]MBL1407596.1 DUF3050 domain-containing protein [Sphingobacterium faecale]
MNKIEEIIAYIQDEREQLLQHPLYSRIKNIEDLRLFTETHVYAVWDFMSLLKSLQRRLTCVRVPWMASDYPNTRYLINEIVLAEESDESIDGTRLSHYEMYLDAMKAMGADTAVIEQFITVIKSGIRVEDAISKLDVDTRIKEFLGYTFDLIFNGGDHEVAAAFTFGREDLIPGMFNAILKEIQIQFPDADLKKFVYYFERHIELDGDEHGPLAMQMIEELGGEDKVKWNAIKQVSKEALKKRIALWDAIYDSIKK